MMATEKKDICKYYLPRETLLFYRVVNRSIKKSFIYVLSPFPVVSFRGYVSRMYLRDSEIDSTMPAQVGVVEEAAEKEPGEEWSLKE